MLPVLHVKYEPLNGHIKWFKSPMPMIECVTVTHHFLEGEPEKRIYSIETIGIAVPNTSLCNRHCLT